MYVIHRQAYHENIHASTLYTVHVEYIHACTATFTKQVYKNIETESVCVYIFYTQSQV